MEKKHNEATGLRPDGDRTVDDNLVSIDLPMAIKQIREESTWKSSKRNAITVFKTDGFRVVLIGLHKDTEMARHIADGIISVQVLEGKMKFNTDNRSVELKEGQMLVLHERIPHSVLAVEECFFLLTLAIISKTKA
jgi:quercetin dioxygenase-like cupin family protein